LGNLRDNKGYNQVFKPSKALEVRTERRCDYIISKINLKGNKRILEIGSGTGELAYMIAKKTGKNVTGIDVCKPFVDKAKKEYKLKGLSYKLIDFNNKKDLAKIRSLGRFDYIIGNGILHHLFYDLHKSLKNIKLMLKDDGGIVFLEPNIFNPYCFFIFKFYLFRKMANLDPEEMAFSRRFIYGRLMDSGFSNIEVRYKDFLLPNTPAFLIKTVIFVGAILERIPLLNMVSQSIFISAKK